MEIKAVHSQSDVHPHRVVIIGGGFGGLSVARKLKHAPVQVTLVDRCNYHLFQPLLYQVATGTLSPANIASPLRNILKNQKNARVLLAEATGLDTANRRILLSDGMLEYDSLVLSTGSSHQYFGHDEWEKFAPGLKTIEDATDMRRRILLAFEAAEREADPVKLRAWMTFVIVGGGATGVELAGALGEIAHDTLRQDFRNIDPSKARIILVEGTDRIIPSYPPRLSAAARKMLERLDVTVRTGAIVSDVQEHSVTIREGEIIEEIPTRTILWAAGVLASPLGGVLCEKTGAGRDKSGRVVVEPDLSVSGNPAIFVIGDLANFSHQGGKSLPGVAQTAIQQGRYVARAIGHRLRGEKIAPFHYVDKGNLATIGRAAAVADLNGLQLSGIPAWLIWIFVHLLYIVEFQNRLLVLVQWAWLYITYDRSARLITEKIRFPSTCESPKSTTIGPDRNLMKRYQSTLFMTVAILAVFLLVAVAYTRNWANNPGLPYGQGAISNPALTPVDMQPLNSARQLAPLAAAPTEKDFAEQALRLADNFVDLAFASAIHDATENPAPATPETQQLTERIKTGVAAVAADQNRITQYSALLAKATSPSRDGLEQLVAVAQAQLALDQDDVDDARQDLIRAGGDRQATIQQLLDQHKDSAAQGPAGLPGAAVDSSASIELTQPKNIVAEVRIWMSLRAKDQLLAHSQAEARARASNLSSTHTAIEKEMQEGKARSSTGSSGSNTALSILQNLSEDKKNLAGFDKRIETEQQLDSVYGKWLDYVGDREKAISHEMLVSILWILLVSLAILIANYSVQHFFSRVGRERRALLTLRALILLLVQVFGVVCILLIVLGIPGNFGTVLALIGAGLTVALKDFIVGFFGWFILMGKNGIRPGDWVEINGVGGEVIQLGFLHTVLLETGNWNDAGHPTGRKVSFVNTFAIEGHYFNFSTTGQWLWDEIEVQIPEGIEPYATAEAIQKIAGSETEANARIAEEEWNRVAPSNGKSSFSAKPSLSVRPTGAGVNALLRYITRANERFEVRARLYRAIVELLHKKAPTKSAVVAPADVPQQQ